MKTIALPFTSVLMILALATRLASASEPVPAQVPDQAQPNLGLTNPAPELATEPALSPNTAVALSIGSTVGGIVLGSVALALAKYDDSGILGVSGLTIMLAGLTFGPSAGQFYTGHWGKGLLFSLGRTGFLALGTVSGIAAAGSGNDGCGLLVVASLVGLVGLSIWDISDSKRDASTHAAEAAKPSISLSPTIIPTGRGADHPPAYGLSLSGSF